jgi:transcription-repair coupling factor (superfamily II helicase)
VRNPLELADLKDEIRDRFGPTTPAVENLFWVMDLRRVLKEFLVQQISLSNGQVFLLFHPESPVKIEKLLELIQKHKKKFRLAPDGRLSFTPQQQNWEALIGEIMQLLNGIRESPPQQSLPLELSQGGSGFGRGFSTSE